MFFDVLHQLAGVFAHPEEVGFFLGFGDLAPAVGAFAIHQLAVGPERLARRAVFALIGALVDIALLVQLAEDGLYFLQCMGSVVRTNLS